MSVTNLNEWKEQGQRKWGPLTNLSRVDAIFEACKYLEQTNDELNRANVRDLIGGGSDRDIGPIIKLYKNLQASREKGALTLVPDTMVQIIAVEVENQLQKIKSTYEEQTNDEKTLFAEATNELSATVEQLEDECDGLKHTIEAKDDRIGALHDEIGIKDAAIQQLQDQLKELDAQYNNALRKNDELTQQLVEKEKTIAANDAKHNDTVAALKQDAKTQREELSQQHNKEIDRLMTLLGNERGEWRQAKQEIQAEVSALQNALQERQKTVESQSAHIIQLNKDRLNQTEALARLKTTEENQSALRAKLDEVSAENKALQKDNERLTQQLPTLQELVSQVAAIQGALTAPQKPQTNKRATTKGKPKKGE